MLGICSFAVPCSRSAGRFCNKSNVPDDNHALFKGGDYL